MTSGRSSNGARAAVIVAWATSAVLATVVAWWAVAVVGDEQVTSDRGRVLSQPEVVTALAARLSAGTSPAAGSPQAPATTAATQSAPAASALPPAVTSDPGLPASSAPPSEVADPTPPAPPATSTPRTSTSGPAAGTAKAGSVTAGSKATSSQIARIWDVPGGRVSAECTGTQISLLYATPTDGWAVNVSLAGPEQIKVELTRDQSETKVAAACVDGVPEMQQTTEAPDS